MRLKIHHETRYHYDKPVHYGLQQLRLRPKERIDQKIFSWDLEIEGGKVEAAFEDQHHNHVDLISIEKGREEIIIRATGEIENSDHHGVIGKHSGFAPLWLFRRNTQKTKPGAGVKRLLRELGDDHENDISKAHRLSEIIREHVAYRIGVTDAGTTAEKAIASGEGVCQDHAHIFCAAARELGFPARYVSGYLMMTDRVDQDATHAWAEAHFDGLGWIGFDISNGHSPDSRYVRVATGLDYEDAAPISGVRFGHGDEDMIVTLQVEQ